MSHVAPATRVPWRTLLRLLWAAYFALLFTSTHAPIPEPVVVITSRFDKLIHALAFGTLGSLTALAWLPLSFGRKETVRLIVGLLIYAVVDEILQGLVGRTPDFYDWLADASGILVGASLTAAVMAGFRGLQTGALTSANRQSQRPPSTSSKRSQTRNQPAVPTVSDS